MEINNLYNFRNLVRYFLNIENIKILPTIDEITIQDLSWPNLLISGLGRISTNIDL